MVLSPHNLVPKLINGQKVKAKDLVQYFKSYMNIYKGNDLPEPKSMLVVCIASFILIRTSIVVADTYYYLIDGVSNALRNLKGVPQGTRFAPKLFVTYC